LLFAQHSTANSTTVPTLLFYNHYDVQPVDSPTKWESDPATLTERDGCWWGRGVADNKGNLLARLAALETYQAIWGDLPINLKFVVDGEHELGSPHLTATLNLKKEMLQADACIWDSGQYIEDGTPVIDLGLKGLLSVELSSRTLAQDAHSGLGGVLPSAIWKLVWALGAINDIKDGILINGFYDDIAVPTKEDSQFLSATREQHAKRHAERLKHFGVEEFTAGLQGLPLLITEFFTPTANISGLESGFMGPGAMTILPAEAKVRLDFRLVPDQDPAKILEQLKEYLANDYRFEDIEVRASGASMKAARTLPTHPFVQLATRTAQAVSGLTPLVTPIAPSSGPLYLFKEAIHDLPTIGVGCGYEGSNQHGPNENIRINDFVQHVKFLVQLIHEMADYPIQSPEPPLEQNLDLVDLPVFEGADATDLSSTSASNITNANLKAVAMAPAPLANGNGLLKTKRKKHKGKAKHINGT
jgi:acetylornithine deacetylase/succinyl-diaminopimelate desuccinylase-like protein